MRLGAWPCKLEPGSFAHRAYGKLEISERHRHRYEFNRDYEKVLTGAGLRITGRTPDENYVEIVEAPDHPWFLGCQFHPGIQIQAARAASALRRVHRRGPRAQEKQVAPASESHRAQAVGVAPHATA